jgi:Flp pilus assembly protein TadG
MGQNRRGVTTIELALVLPILLMVLLAGVQLGTYLMAKQAIEGAAMVGTREATLPSATPQRVQTAIMGALAGWSFTAAMSNNDIQIVDLPAEGSVSVTVTVDADKAALSPLCSLPGFDLTGRKIGACYVLRKE